MTADLLSKYALFKTHRYKVLHSTIGGEMQSVCFDLTKTESSSSSITVAFYKITQFIWQLSGGEGGRN